MARKKKLPPGYRETANGKFEYRFRMFDKQYSVTAASINECMQKAAAKILKVEQEREEEQKREEARKEREALGLKETRLSDVTLDEFYDVWENNRRDEVKAVTVRKQRFEFNTMSKQSVDDQGRRFGSLLVREIVKQDILTMRKGLLKHKTINGTNQSICLLKHVLDDAVDNEIILRNPAKRVKAIPIPPTEKDAFTAHRAMTIPETYAFLDDARKNEAEYYNLLVFLLFTGMRHGEACALRFGDIHKSDTGVCTVKICKTITKQESGVYVIGETTKTRAGTRTVFLLPEAVQAIRNQREQRRLSEHREIPDDELIFRGHGGGIVDVCHTTRVCRRICKRAGIPPVSCHALRATFATRCVENGVDYKSLSEHLGHKDIGVTMNVYAKSLEDTREKEISKVQIV